MENKPGLSVLVVDDERTIRSFLKATLKSKGYSVSEAKDGATANELTASLNPDLVILDLGLPDMDGLDVLKNIRKASNVPVIILSVRDDESDKIAALDMGADDYLTKPFDAGELLARIRSVLRRIQPGTADTVYKTGKLTMDTARHQVTIGKEPVKLTPMEYDFLKMLVISGGRVVTHKRILKDIWNRDEETDDAMHLLRVTVSNIRNKIEPDPNRPVYITTEPGIGYRLSEEE
jgi:two-component system KDP operon response regulator KdpE